MLKKIREQLKKKNGFSLIELLVVIAIMGVIALVAIPNVVNALDNSKKNADKANASAIATAVTAAIASGDQSTTLARTEFSSLDSKVTDNLQSVPTVKFDGENGTVDHAFYVTITSGKVAVSTKTGTDSYADIYPVPDSPWDN